ncbi:MAG: protein kinase [Gemmataceae bacterium]|nr:protein kinase [Gemmataceae bacterium]
MPVRIEPNAEPIPGYRLIERLGGGGFGEVWKAEAPGGLFKAIKFVFGDLSASEDADGARATQELKALSRVKTVHHPYILSLERYDIIEGQLIIVMELADRTLWDRFRECRGQGLPGIPRTELLTYIEETAEALDLMNVQFQLQHLDIKPQNIFLVFNHVKVADFGLVKDLGNMAAATVTGGVTPVYAAPETFDGWLSRYSDQYSLAIVYQELLTGQRPFTGTTMRQLVLQHLQGAPDVSPLPMRDRAIVQRALAKNPDERYPTCVEFVQALIAAGAAKPGAMPAPPSAPEPTPPPAQTKRSAVTPEQAEDVERTRDARGQRPFVRPPAEHKTPVADDDALRPNMLPPRPTGVATPPVPSDPLESATLTQVNRPKASGSGPAKLGDSGFRGIVQPSLIIGLGKLGVQTLMAVRRTLSHAFGHANAIPHVRLVGIDIDPETIQAAGQGDNDTILRSNELVLARLHRPSHYLQQRTRDGELSTDSWLNSKLIYRLPKQLKTAGLRALGRLAFVDNFRHIVKRLDAELEACASQETLHDTSKQPDLGIRSPVPRVYVVACLGGTTGSGMFLDTAYAVRHLLRRHGFARADVVGLFFLPPTDKQGIRSAALAQAYAALTELHHYASGQSAFSARYHGADAANNVQSINEASPPFERCMFLTLPATPPSALDTEAIPEPAALAGQFLYHEVATRMGKTIDAARHEWRLNSLSLDKCTTYQTFGLYRVLWPRRQIIKQAAHRLCGRLVARWMTKDAAPLVNTLAAWAQEQWDEAGLRPEALIGRHQELCEKQLRQPAERVLQGVLNPLIDILTPPNTGQAPPPPINVGPVLNALSSLEKLLGIPDECRPGTPTTVTPGTIEKILDDGAGGLADDIDRQLTSLVVRLLEEPAFRLAGAEEGLRQFSRIAEQSLQGQETLTKELHDRAALLHQRIHKFLEAPQPQNLSQTNTVWKFALTRKSTPGVNLGADLLELLRVYAKTRYQCLILRHISRLYVSLRGHLSDQIREVGFCRQRLSELAKLVEEKPAAAAMKSASEKVLLPTGCAALTDAVERLHEDVTADDLLAFDAVMQTIIAKQFRALLNVCMGPSNLVRNLTPLMIQEAEAFLTPRVPEAVATEFGIHDDDAAQDRGEPLASAFDAAAPKLGKPSAPKEITVAAFPDTPAGHHLKEIAKEALPNVTVIDSDDRDAIVFYRELQQVSLQDLEQYGAIAQEAYRQRSAGDPTYLHTRIDITAWQLAAT